MLTKNQRYYINKTGFHLPLQNDEKLPFLSVLHQKLVLFSKEPIYLKTLPYF